MNTQALVDFPSSSSTQAFYDHSITIHEEQARKINK
jgi:hypothetical protein